VAEVVSASDSKWSEKKREIYKLHEACTCILTVQQDRTEVCIDRCVDSRWSETILESPDDLLILDDFGLQCKVSDLYRGTLLET
jgi:hypothetical protein